MILFTGIMAVLAVVGLILASAAIHGITQQVHEVADAARSYRIASLACLERIERCLDDMAKQAAITEDHILSSQRTWSNVVTEMHTKRLDDLTAALREIVHETPDFAITGDDGEVPIRRMRSLRVHLARMEEQSRVAAEGNR